MSQEQANQQLTLGGETLRLTQHRQEIITDTEYAPRLLATIHPSVALRLPTPAEREQARHQLAEDLTLAGKLAQTAG